MSKGEQTRERIVERAAELFNQQGYAGASMSALMEATGLKKGGIYRHFESKEALAVEAFDFAVGRMRERFREALAGRESAIDRLRAFVEVFAAIPTNPPIPGGCPLLNASVEHDDGNAVLRERVRREVGRVRRSIARTIQRGVEGGEIRPDVDPDELATVIVAMLEGGIMLSGLYGDPVHARRVARHLTRYLEEQVAT